MVVTVVWLARVLYNLEVMGLTLGPEAERLRCKVWS
jgi:hypothetical protein